MTVNLLDRLVEELSGPPLCPWDARLPQHINDGGMHSGVWPPPALLHRLHAAKNNISIAFMYTTSIIWLVHGVTCVNVSVGVYMPESL